MTAVGDARKRRQPEVEQSPTVLRADLDWMTQVADAAMENHRRADARRVEAVEQVGRLTQAMWQVWAELGFDTDGDTGPGPMIAGAGLNGWISWWLRDIREHIKDEAVNDAELSARVTRLEHALRQAVIDIRDEMAPENIIRALEHADTGADHE